MNNIPIFKENVCQLKETSRDHNCSPNEFMTECVQAVINFDDVKDEYIKELHLSEAPKSTDALYIKKDSEIYFIEFKNGFMDNVKIYALKRKIYDSLLIISDIISKTISYTRKYLNYIVVYNEERNPEINIKNEVQNSVSRTTIAKYLIDKKSNGKFVLFGLLRFEKIYFKEVFTYTKEEFENNFIKKVF